MVSSIQSVRKTYQGYLNGFRTQFHQTFFSLGRVFSYSRPYMKLIIGGNIALFFGSLSAILLPVFLGKVPDEMQKDDKIARLKEILPGIAAVLVGNIIFMLIKEFCFDLLAIRVTSDMRKDLFKSLINKDIEFYDTKKSGDLASRLTGDIEKVQHSSINDIANICRRILELIGSLCMLLWISKKLTLILFVFVPIKIGMLMLVGGRTKANSKLVRKSISDANSSANEAFQNIRVIKAFSTEDKEEKIYVDRLNGVNNLELRCLIMNTLISLFRTSFAFLGLIFMIYYGGKMVADGEITIGNLTTFMFTGLSSSTAFNSIDKTLKRIAASLGACDRIFEILDYESRIKCNTDEGEKKETLNGDIAIKNLSFSYPTKSDVTVLRQVDVNIKSGETIALVGSSGSGKTTLTSLIQRFYEANKGDLMIDGLPIHKYNLRWLHQQIGYVPQEPSLFSGTIEENITYGVSDYTKETLDYAIKMANATFIYDKSQFPLGLETKVGERGAKLSGGQKQRVAIARAIIKNPKILIFDEATSALDAESEHQVQKAIDTLMTDKGKTLLIIAHRLSTIINCKRILVFQHGQIVEEGTHHDLLKADGIYKSLVERQLAGFDV